MHSRTTRLAFVVASLLVAGVALARPARAQGFSQLGGLGSSGGGELVGLGAMGLVVTGGFAVAGLVGDGVLAVELGRTHTAPVGWAVYGTAFWGVSTVATGVVTVALAGGGVGGPVPLMSLGALALSGSSLALSIYALAHPPHAAEPRRAVAGLRSFTVAPTLARGASGLVVGATF